MRDVIVPPSLAEAAQAAGFSPAVRAGGFLFLTGATGGLPYGTMPESAGKQARVALGKVCDILAHAGGGPSDVVELTSYHARIRDEFTEVETVMRDIFAAPLPAWTAVGVAELRRPGALVEFRVIARQPDRNGKDTP